MRIKNKNLVSVVDKVYKYCEENPSFNNLSKGKYTKVNKFPDMSYEALIENKKLGERIIEEIRQIKEDEKLSNYDDLAADVTSYFVKYLMFPESIEMDEYYYLTFNITAYNCMLALIWNDLSLFDVSTEDNVKKHIELVKDFVSFTKNLRDKTFKQKEMGIYFFSFALDSAIGLMKNLAIDDYNKHPLCIKKEGSVATDEQISIEKEYIIEANKNFLEIAELLDSKEYRERAPINPGWGQFSKGLEYYKACRINHLSYDIEAKDLHELGKRLLAETLEKQGELRKKLGFDCSHDEFLLKLKGNERFYPKEAEKIGEMMNAFRDKIDSELDRYFNEKITAPCVAKRLALNLEPVMTFGFFTGSKARGEEGVYYYNGSGLEEKCQINIPFIVSHELLPGHHFQASVVLESETLHPLFQKMFTTCYSEGWAEYAASLVEEMGLFRDEFDEYGKLEMDKFICVRMVVDTGLNELGWTLKEAEDYILENTFATPQMAKTEAIRYAALLPAQCIPYKYGSVKMAELRKRFEEKRASKFDIKEFHSLVLGVGNVPMALLEKYVERYMVENE